MGEIDSSNGGKDECRLCSDPLPEGRRKGPLNPHFVHLFNIPLCLWLDVCGSIRTCVLVQFPAVFVRGSIRTWCTCSMALCVCVCAWFVGFVGTGVSDDEIAHILPAIIIAVLGTVAGFVVCFGVSERSVPAQGSLQACPSRERKRNLSGASAKGT
jgi:hypothetical protein